MTKKPSNSLETFNFLYSVVIIFIFIALAVSSFFNRGRIGYNFDVLTTFGIGAVVGGFIALVFFVLQTANVVVKRTTDEQIPAKTGFVSESNDFAPASKNIFTKLGLQFVWVIVVILLASSGFQIWGTPDVHTTVEFATAGSTEPLSSQQFSVARNLWDVGVLPGFTEDMAAFGLSAVLIVAFSLVLLIMKRITNNNIFKYNFGWHILAILIACPIAAVGLGFIPCFAQAHESVAGSNIAFLVATFAFQTINLYVMWITGMFFPLAHIVHNAIFVFNFVFAFSIAFMFIPILRKRWFPIFDLRSQWRWFSWEH